MTHHHFTVECSKEGHLVKTVAFDTKREAVKYASRQTVYFPMCEVWLNMDDASDRFLQGVATVDGYSRC